MVDFPIRKWDFRVGGWSGLWSLLGAPGEKKRENQMYLQDSHTFAPLRSQNFRKKSPDFFAKMIENFIFIFIPAKFDEFCHFTDEF